MARKRRRRRTSEGEEGKASVGEHVPIPHEASVGLRGWRREGASHKRVITRRIRQRTHPLQIPELKVAFYQEKRKTCKIESIAYVKIVVKCVGFYYGGSIYDEAP